MRAGIFCAVALLIASRVAPADAATLHLYFSTTGLDQQNLAAPPPEALTHVNPIVTVGTPVYLFAEVTDSGTWNGIALNYTGADGIVSLLVSPIPEPQHWNGNSDRLGRLDGSDPTNLIAIQEPGLPNPYPLGFLDNYEAPGGSAPGAETFYLGDVTTSASGAVFLHVGGISRVGGDPNVDNVFFGWGDNPVHGNDPGRASDVADLTIVPEPAGLTMPLVILLRRR